MAYFLKEIKYAEQQNGFCLVHTRVVIAYYNDSVRSVMELSRRKRDKGLYHLPAPGSNQVVCKFYLQQWVTLGVRVNYVGKEAGDGSLNNFLICNSLAFIHA